MIDSLAETVLHISPNHPFRQAIRDLENPRATCPIGRMVGGKHSLSPHDLEHFVNLLEFSLRRLLVNLRNSDTASLNIDPWILLRTSATYLAMATCLSQEDNPHVRNGIAACDEVVQVLAAIFWIKRVQLEVIPVLLEFRKGASDVDIAMWDTIILLEELGVRSLVSVFATGRPDVSVSCPLSVTASLTTHADVYSGQPPKRMPSRS